ncbi:MAG TPA: aromatic ring-hydroxylating dioxygenase subunit alpha [Xanthobacteraceae bacterium]|jgi:vanillate O-demethylase monooxygenase subunit
MDQFLHDQWYTAATSAEVGDKPLARTVCNEPLVIFRGNGGDIAVLTDRCPHRKAPLSAGEVVGNDIQCSYHGIRFASDGACTHVPGNAPVGRNFRARSFPARERHGLIFVWLGEASLADPALIPDFSENVQPGWTGVHGILHVKANYQLLLDNILDLTHVVFVHKTTLSGGGVAETPLEVEIDGDVVRARRLMRNVDTAPIYKAARNLHGKIDRWQFLEFRAPIYARITLGAREAGSELPFGTPTHIVLNSFTPETERTTHYFWSTVRSWGLDDAKVSKIYKDMTDLAFAEDARIVELQQRLIDSDASGAPLVSLAFDRAGLAARRIIKRKLEEEAAARTRAASVGTSLHARSQA